MTGGRLKDAVLAAMAGRDAMHLGEVRGVILSTYSEAELLRCSVYRSATVSKLKRLYVSGEPLTHEQRSQLVWLGVNAVIDRLIRNGKGWIHVDTKSQTASRVRSEVDAKGLCSKAGRRVSVRVRVPRRDEVPRVRTS